MDPATRVQIAGLLFTVVLPVGAAVATLLIGRKLRPGDDHPIIVGLAAVVGVVVAGIGISGAPGLPLADADDWLIYGPLIAGALGLALDRFGGRLTAGQRPYVVGALAIGLSAVLVWRLLSRLAALWQDGVVAPLTTTAWALDAVAMMAVTWLALDHAARAANTGELRSAPLVLGPLALALIGAAVATGLSGSARIGQHLGGVAAVIGVVGLIGWRWPDLRPGHGAVAAGAVALTLGLVYAHAFVDLPRPVAGLLMLSPLGALVGLGLRRTLPAVLLAMAFSGALVGVGAGLTAAHEVAQLAAEGEAPGGGENGAGDGGEGSGDAPADEDGAYYPY